MDTIIKILREVDDAKLFKRSFLRLVKKNLDMKHTANSEFATGGIVLN